MERKYKVKMPTKSTLKNRKSTINNAFVYSIMPWKKLTEEEYESICKELKIKENQCAYCLKENATTMDHLNGLVNNREPSGFYTEKNNLVPCCSHCNSSKGNKTFESWYTDDRSDEIGITKEKMQQRRKIIYEYMKNNPARKLNLKQILGKKDYEKYIRMKDELLEKIEECEKYCEKLNKKINEQKEDWK